MAGAALGEVLCAYRDASTLEEAERALRSLERLGLSDDLSVGDLYDDLAGLAAERGDFRLAVRAQRRAIELGCDMPELGRQMLGWYLMKGGERAAGEAEFGALRDELGEEPNLLIMLGGARADAGDEPAALEAFDRALMAAKSLGDPDTIEMARQERRYARDQLRLPPDQDDLSTSRHS